MIAPYLLDKVAVKAGYLLRTLRVNLIVNIRAYGFLGLRTALRNFQRAQGARAPAFLNARYTSKTMIVQVSLGINL